MEEREKHVQEYSTRNFLVVYGHQDQIENAYRAGWDEALKYLHFVSVREALNIISKEVKK